ncbi:hypothetical protein FUA23_11485 [Neolewinella aurantiaca]|uniref:Uncharacterized protein n=1 Tax=Neolewinella aurantiaca TaxID=2602767 RepID=A0A5C7FH72_9BACT|nr:hypothetical protein [Neolewinella aurantiaca]TXF89127.1 hypothetical protein FUA23_11485 [Neolewinella aurantiaca]
MKKIIFPLPPDLSAFLEEGGETISQLGEHTFVVDKEKVITLGSLNFPDPVDTLGFEVWLWTEFAKESLFNRVPHGGDNFSCKGKIVSFIDSLPCSVTLLFNRDPEYFLYPSIRLESKSVFSKWVNGESISSKFLSNISELGSIPT